MKFSTIDRRLALGVSKDRAYIVALTDRVRDLLARLVSSDILPVFLTPERYIPRDAPSQVRTSFIGQSILKTLRQ